MVNFTLITANTIPNSSIATVSLGKPIELANMFTTASPNVYVRNITPANKAKAINININNIIVLSSFFKILSVYHCDTPIKVF